MLNMLLPYINDVDQRAIPAYQLFLKSQSQIIRERYLRLYNALGHETKGMSLLRYILSFVDMDYMFSQANNYDRYLYHARYIKKNLDNIYDRVQRGRGYFNMFFSKEFATTEEFIMPIDDVNTIINLPLDTEDWNVWKYVKPVRLLSHDSLEFTTNLMNDTLHYGTITPTYAVISIDTIGLIFKYFSWYRHARQTETAEELVNSVPQQYFLHKYVLCDLIWDSSDIWLINILSAMQGYLKEHDMSEFTKQYDTRSLQFDMHWGRIALNATEGFRTIGTLISESKKTFRPEGLLTSKVLFSGSINNRIRMITDRLQLPLYRPYEYLRWIRDKELFKLVIGIFQNRPELPTTTRLVYNVRKDMDRLIARRPWTNCQNVMLKDTIEDEIVTFTDSIR